MVFNHELHKFHELFLLPRLTSNIGSVDKYWGHGLCIVAELWMESKTKT